MSNVDFLPVFDTV